MESPFDNYVTSGVLGPEEDVIIYHHQEDYYCHYQCGKSFVEICKELGLDKDKTQISL